MSIHFPAKIFNCYLTPCKNAGNFLVSIYLLEKMMEIYYCPFTSLQKSCKISILLQNAVYLLCLSTALQKC